MNAETIVFLVFAAISVAGGLVMIGARNPVYSAMGLLGSMFSMAVFYVLNNAHFIAAVQVIIYAGAVMTLFLFVVMLIGVDRAEDRKEKLPLQRPLVLLAGVALLGLLINAGRAAWITGNSTFANEELNGTIGAVAEELFGTWLLPFEATIFLLTIAAVGTVSLAFFAERPRTVLGTPDGEEGS